MTLLMFRAYTHSKQTLKYLFQTIWLRFQHARTAKKKKKRYQKLISKGDFTHHLPCRSTGSHLNLRTWCVGRLSRGPERRRDAAQGCTTPGHKTASTKTSSVSPDSDSWTQKKRKPKHMRNRKAMVMKRRVRNDRFLDKNGMEQLQLSKC